ERRERREREQYEGGTARRLPRRLPESPGLGCYTLSASLGIGKPKRHDPDAQVHERGAPEARLDADPFDEKEPRERRADHRTQRVETVQPAQRVLQLSAVRARERPREHRERPAHE